MLHLSQSEEWLLMEVKWCSQGQRLDRTLPMWAVCPNGPGEATDINEELDIACSKNNSIHLEYNETN